MTEFSHLFDGVVMNAPGDGLPQVEWVCEEELIDNQETETPVTTSSYNGT
jgi:hypothetical protein